MAPINGDGMYILLRPTAAAVARTLSTSPFTSRVRNRCRLTASGQNAACTGDPRTSGSFAARRETYGSSERIQLFGVQRSVRFDVHVARVSCQTGSRGYPGNGSRNQLLPAPRRCAPCVSETAAVVREFLDIAGAFQTVEIFINQARDLPCLSL